MRVGVADTVIDGSGAGGSAGFVHDKIKIMLETYPLSNRLYHLG